MKTALILSTALITSIGNSNQANSRAIQYANGVKDILKRFNLTENLEIFICDNTIENEDLLNLELKKVLNDINIRNKFYLNENSYGKINKGCGLISQWNYILPTLVDTFEYIIHYEPRQILENEMFFNTFISKPFNIFKTDAVIIYKFKILPYIYNHFQTGLFSCKTSVLLSFTKSINIERMAVYKKSIEREMYLYFKKNKIPYNTIKILGLIWDSSGKSIKL